MKFSIKACTLSIISALLLTISLSGIETLRAEKNFDLEINKLQEALRRNPTNPVHNYNLGYFLYKKGQIDGAIIHYIKAIELKSDFASAHHNLAAAYVDQERWTEAVKHYKIAIQLKPEVASSHFNLGVIYYRLKKYRQALKLLGKTVQLDNEHEDAYTYMGALYFRLKQYGNSLESYRHGLRINPRNAKSQNSAGHAAILAGKYLNAHHHLHMALGLKHDYRKAFNNLALLYEKTGNIEQATIRYRKLCKKGEQFACKDRNRLEIKYYESVRNYNEGFTFYKLGQTERARERWRQAVAQNRDFSPALYSLGFLEMTLGNNKKSRTFFEKTLAVNPLHVNAYYNLATLLIRKAQYNQAAVYLEKIVQLDGKNKSALARLGEVYEKKGDPSMAIKYFRRSCNLSDDRSCSRWNKLRH